MEKPEKVFSTISDQVGMLEKGKISWMSDHSVSYSHSGQTSFHHFNKTKLHQLRIQNIINADSRLIWSIKVYYKKVLYYVVREIDSSPPRI